MVNWYRAAARSQRKLASLGRITVPTLMIWGAKDFALGREMAQPSIDLCDHGRLVFIEEAGHFVQHEEPARVNELLLLSTCTDRCARFCLAALAKLTTPW